MTQADRDGVIDAFLKAEGWALAERRPLAADWSTRRYLRLVKGPVTAILMDAPAPWTHQVAPFLRVAAILRASGLSAPDVYAADTEVGLALVEDFGDSLLSKVVDQGGAAATGAYALATDVLSAVRQRIDPALSLRAFDIGRFVSEVELFAEPGVRALTGKAPDAASAAALREAWRQVLAPVEAVPRTLMLRDYFPGNLIDLPGRDGIRRCGLLDIQDAGIGPIAYDIMSLVEDTRRDVPPDVAAAVVARYLDGATGIDRDAFRQAMTVLGAVRHARILGRLAEITAENPNAPQRAFLPRTARQLAEKLADPALAPVARWMRDELPADCLTRLWRV